MSTETEAANDVRSSESEPFLALPDGRGGRPMIQNAPSVLDGLDIAERRESVLATIPDAEAFDHEIGAFFTTTGVGRLQHLSNPTVLRYARAGNLFALPSVSGYLFPQFQFASSGTVPGDLFRVVAILSSLPRWEAARWLARGNRGAKRPIDLIHEGDGAKALERANRYARLHRPKVGRA